MSTQRTFRFDTSNNWPDDDRETICDWLASFGLRPTWMLRDTTVVFDVAAHTITTLYVTTAPGTSPDADVRTAVMGADGRPVTEVATVPYPADTLPELPARFRRFRGVTVT